MICCCYYYFLVLVVSLHFVVVEEVITFVLVESVFQTSLRVKLPRLEPQEKLKHYYYHFVVVVAEEDVPEFFEPSLLGFSKADQFYFGVSSNHPWSRVCLRFLYPSPPVPVVVVC